MKKTFKEMIGPQWRFRAHRLGRLRWGTKYRLMRGFDAEVGWGRKLAYVLLDPEIESFSYELENEGEVIAALADALGHPVEELAGYAAETHRDPELNELLARRLRWRFDVKRRMPLGNRLAWYVIARARKPALVVETGIYLGLGSLALLRALERNAEEGHPGELMSFDSVATAGSIVPERARAAWNRFVGSTGDLLPSAVENRRVDMLFQDTPHTEANQRFEFGAALSNAGESLLLLDASGGTSPALEKMCQERGGSYHRIPLCSRQHIYPGAAIAFGVFEEAGREDALGG